MADFSFLDKLNEQQLQVADKIITRAQSMGINPRLALSLAYVESGLSMGKTGDAGEIGIMQIKPATGKLLGYDEKSLQDPDTNIDAGLTYLKQGIERYKDPMLGVVAYNAGHDNKFLLGKDENPPASTLQYINKIDALGGFTEPPAPEASTEGVTGAPSETDGTITPASEEDYRGLKAAGLGAGVGAAAGEAAKIIGAGKNLVSNISRPPAAAGTPVEKWSQAMGYGQRGAPTMAKAHEAEMGTRKGAQVRNPATGQTFKPQFRVEKPPIIEPAPGQVMSGLKTASDFLSRSPVITGALTGAGIASGAQEASSRYQQGDIPGALIAGAGAVGSGMAAIPHPLTRAIGSGVAIASPAGLYLLDKMRERSAKEQMGALP